MKAQVRSSKKRIFRKVMWPRWVFWGAIGCVAILAAAIVLALMDDGDDAPIDSGPYELVPQDQMNPAD